MDARAKQTATAAVTVATITALDDLPCSIVSVYLVALVLATVASNNTTICSIHDHVCYQTSMT
jgi:hypothetical protein